MGLTEKFLAFTLLGAEWVLWLLVALSVISVAIMIERALFYRARRIDVDNLTHDLRAAISRGEPDAAVKKYGAVDALETVVGLAGAKEAGRGADAAAEAMVGVRARHRLTYERNLNFLGTLGNNAPFIGLFGTVLGVIRAFSDLSKNSQQGADAVMAGISEALVATAVGLLVAIPAVIAFNVFQRRVKAAVAAADAVAHSLLAQLKGESERA